MFTEGYTIADSTGSLPGQHIRVHCRELGGDKWCSGTVLYIEWCGPTALRTNPPHLVVTCRLRHWNPGRGGSLDAAHWNEKGCVHYTMGRRVIRQNSSIGRYQARYQIRINSKQQNGEDELKETMLSCQYTVMLLIRRFGARKVRLKSKNAPDYTFWKLIAVSWGAFWENLIGYFSISL